MADSNTPIVDPTLVGEVWPAAVPAEDPVLYGQARLEPEGAFQVRSYQTFKLVYTAQSAGHGCVRKGANRVLAASYGV